MWRTRLLASSVLFAAPLACLSRSLSSYCESKDEKDEIINVYLKEDSVRMLDKFLKNRGYTNHKAEYVCIHSKANSSISYIFQPLFSQRAAFRIRGIVDLPDGNAVAVGRLSNMVGELKDDHFEVSMPIINTTLNNVDEKLLMDLPTRIKKVLNLASKPQWKGKVPAGNVGEQKYDAVQVSYTALPLMKQLVVDGTVCGSSYLDGEKKCSFDPSLVSTESDDHVTGEEVGSEDIVHHELKEKEHDGGKSSVGEQESKDEGDVENKKECPVCKYMKGGPCKDEFIAWDSCIGNLKEDQELTECFEPTKAMMKCMQQHEYYDIMTAGVDQGKLDQTEPPKEKSE